MYSGIQLNFLKEGHTMQENITSITVFTDWEIPLHCAKLRRKEGDRIEL